MRAATGILTIYNIEYKPKFILSIGLTHTHTHTHTAEKFCQLHLSDFEIPYLNMCANQKRTMDYQVRGHKMGMRHRPMVERTLSRAN